MALMGNGMPRMPAEKKGIFKFFEIYGRRCWNLMGLNLLYFIIFLPSLLGGYLVNKTQSYAPLSLALLTAIMFGPATAAMTKICRNYSQERNAFLLSDFFDTIKKNIKQSLIMGIIDTIFILGFAVAIPTYKINAEENPVIYIPFAISLSCLIVFFMMHFYIYLMIVSTNLNMRQILKNSFFLVFLGVKQGIYCLLVIIAVVALMAMLWPYTLFIIPFWPFSFICFAICFNCYPVIRKIVIQPYYDARGEENPEFDYLRKKPDENLFEDSPQLEKTEKKQSSGKKGRTIS